MQNTRPTQHALRAVVKGAGVVAATGLAVAAGWTAWSTLFINHRRKLPPAIDAKRYVTATPLIGRMSFYADDSASGRPLVLVHSINAAASSYEMRPIFEYYRGRRPVYALDLPGFGFSERADRRYSPDLFVEAILEFVDGELPGAEPVDLAALSLSSEFAAIAAVEEPGAFHSLVLIAPTGFGQETPQASERGYKAASFPVWGQAVYDLIVSRPSIHYFLGKAFGGPVDAGLEDYGYLTSHCPGARHAPLHFLSGRLFTPGISEYYAAVPHPVLAFCDRSDFGGGSRMLKDFAVEHANWSFACAGNSKAMPHFECPDETFAEIDRFFGIGVAALSRA